MFPAHPLYATDALAAALDADGVATVPALLDAPRCAELRAAIDALTPQGWDEAHDDPLGGGRALDRYLCVFNRDPRWLPLLDPPGVIDLAESVLGADCHVIGMTAWRCHPGYRGDGLHVDHLPLEWPADRLPAAVRVPIAILTVHYYLNDVTPDLAPTRVIPGSHRAGRAPYAHETHWQGRRPEPVLAAAGDALVFRSELWHAGSDNTTRDRVRHLLQVHYGRRTVAPHYVPFIGWQHRPETLAAATPRQRRLMGDHAPGAYD